MAAIYALLAAVRVAAWRPRSLRTPIRMVEGHSVHRVAARHRRHLVGKKFACTSPNGRFTEGAAAINNKPFRAIEAVGKNLFAWFGSGGADDVCVHVHFGMAGNWAVFESDANGNVHEPATTATTRLRMEGGGVVSHLSAMTVKHGSRAELYEVKRSNLGEDPLRDDADVCFRVPIFLFVADDLSHRWSGSGRRSRARRRVSARSSWTSPASVARATSIARRSSSRRASTPTSWARTSRAPSSTRCGATVWSCCSAASLRDPSSRSILLMMRGTGPTCAATCRCGVLPSN